jgi:3-hydroxyisobutyrate dehydrogenase-like beta-hydroxyacid dehydrogenase
MSPSGPIGVVGLGLLGGAIAARLVEQGRKVVGFDLAAERRDAAAAAGVSPVETLEEVFARCDTVFTSLPDGPVVAKVLAEFGANLDGRHTLVDTTTAAPEQMIAHAELVRGRGAAFVEAEVAGSSVQLRRGEALVLAAGDWKTVETVCGLLALLAAEVHYVGPSGSAAKLKLVHNLVLGLHRAVLAEGLSLAEGLGLDVGKTLEILERSPAGSRVMATKGPKMVARDFKPQATVRQHLKDVRLILAAAAGAGRGAPLSEVHAGLLERAIELGHSESDNSAVITALEAMRAPAVGKRLEAE